MKYVLLVITYVAVSYACSCLPFSTPKDAFCSSDFVSHVKVLGKTDPNANSDGLQDIRYSVQHICVYRKPSNVQVLRNEIITASNSAACGVELTVGKEYLLGGSVEGAGSILRSNLCGIVEEWSNVPQKDKDALKTYMCQSY